MASSLVASLSVSCRRQSALVPRPCRWCFLLLSIDSVVESSFIIDVLLDIVGSESLFILVSVVGIVVVVDFCRRRRERCPWSSSVVVVVFVCLVAVSGSRRRYWMMPSWRAPMFITIPTYKIFFQVYMHRSK